MQRARRFRGEQYDRDMVTNLPTSNRDALGEPSRKRKSSYDHQRSMASTTRGYGFPRRSGPKSYTDDLRDKELQSSIPASPRRESSHFRGYPCDSPHRESSHFRDHPCASPRRESSHFRDYPSASPRRESSHFRSCPRRTPSRDRKNYAESCHFNKRDHYETKSEHTEYSSFRGQLQSPYRKDLSSLSVGHTHKTSKWPASITEDSNQFGYREANEQKTNDMNVSQFQKLRNCAPEKPDQMEVLATSSHDQSSENMGKSQNFHQVNKTGAFVVNIHESDCQTYRTSRWSSLMTEAVSHFGSRESNAHIAREENACNYQEFHNSGLQKAEQVNVMASHSCDIRFKNPRESQGMQQSFLKPQAPAVGFDQKSWQTHKASEWPPEMAEDFDQPPNREADYHFGSHEPNACVAREDNSSNYDGFWNSGLQRAEQVNVMASNSCDVGFKNLRESQSMQQSFLKPQAPAVGFDEKGQHTHKASEWPPAMAEHFDQQSNREQHASRFQEFQNFGPQNLAQMKAVGSSSHEQASVNSLKQNFVNPRGFGSDFDVKCSDQEVRKSESSSNVKRIGEAFTFTGFDNDKMFGDSAGSSECDLQHETSRLLQNAIRLLSAASGIVSAENSGGEVQCQDNVKIMKLLLDSGIQNLKHSLVETTISKKIEASPNLDTFGPNGEKDSVTLDDQCKLENKASAFTEKLWDGILQLSASVSVSAAAFFKSGEKMQDFSWSGSVEVKGKVRLEAFEKYVQDLPRSRSRGLMVRQVDHHALCYFSCCATFKLEALSACCL
ncbi:hypothetical protein Cgig2_021141 [Carnegiea gigantea]|uniref:Spen paralogue and orthologue SPOC C-terminal domain-containing protein n=1 Tax=Carnegiea gigantea TaxID=171969 RepID=A0A9Q1KXF5_9CARY|nr:hypothetical protein Cgig2_021141 [Carnegiea gigantea]